MTDTNTTLSPEVATLLDAVDRAPDAPAARDPLTAILLQPAVRRLLPILEERGALARWLPELAALRGVSQLPDHHRHVQRDHPHGGKRSDARQGR